MITIDKQDLERFCDDDGDTERCGLILVDNQGNTRIVEVENNHTEHKHSFAITNDQVRGVQQANPYHRVVGYFHTHTAPSNHYPSNSDIHNLSSTALGIVLYPAERRFTWYDRKGIIGMDRL
jgi:proteasome lid subunit RPN8/RPN11